MAPGKKRKSPSKSSSSRRGSKSRNPNAMKTGGQSAAQSAPSATVNGDPASTRKRVDFSSVSLLDAAFSECGEWLAVTSTFGGVMAWNMPAYTSSSSRVWGNEDEEENADSENATSKMTFGFQAHGAAVNALAISKDVMVTGGDEEMRIWSLPWKENNENGARMISEITVPQHRGFRGALSQVAEVNGISLDDAGRRVYAAAGDSNAYCWDVETGAVLDTFQGHHDYLQCVVLLEHSSMLATGSEDGTVKLWDLRASGKNAISTMRLSPIDDEDAVVMCAAASSSEDWLAFGGSVGGANGMMKCCHVASRKVFSSTPMDAFSTVQDVKYAREGGVVAVGDAPEMLTWTIDGTRLTRRVATSSPSVYAFAQHVGGSKDGNNFPGCSVAVGASPLVDVYADPCSRAFSFRYDYYYTGTK